MNLEKKYKGTVLNGIFFTELDISEPYSILRSIKVRSEKMNANLAFVKQKMAKEAKQLSADAIIRFKYGQKRSLLSLWDDTVWYGEGDAVKVKSSAT
jgi:hypothetical protein